MQFLELSCSGVRPEWVAFGPEPERTIKILAHPGLGEDRRAGRWQTRQLRPEPVIGSIDLLDHLVCGGQQRFGDGEAEGFGGLEVDD